MGSKAITGQIKCADLDKLQEEALYKLQQARETVVAAIVSQLSKQLQQRTTNG